MLCCCCFFFQAEDGIRDLVRSRGLGDVYKRQEQKTVVLKVEGMTCGGCSSSVNKKLGATPGVVSCLSLIHI